MHLELFLQFSYKVGSVHSSIGWYVFSPSHIILLDFFSNYRLCLSFWDEIHGVDGRPFGLRLLRILNLRLLRAFLSCCHPLLFCIDLFLRFWFRLWIVQLRLFRNVVEIEELLPGLCFSPKYLPQSLLLFELLWIDFCIFH